MAKVQFPLAVVITGQDVGLEAALGKANQRLRATGQLATSIGRGLTYGITLPMLALGAAAVRTGTAVESNILQVRAAANLSARQANDLRLQARAYGELGIGVRDATEGMVSYAKAGLTLEEINATMTPTILLAKSANQEFGAVADGLVNVMSGFRKPFGEAAQVVDSLAFAADATTNDVSDLFEALKFGGPVAAGMNQTFEDTVALLALMGQNGFRATLGGTAMRDMLGDLANVTPQAQAHLAKLGITPAMWKTSTGEMKSLIDIVSLLEQKGAGTEEVMAIFGKTSGPALASILGKGSAAVRALSEQLERSGGSAMKKYQMVTSGARGAQDRFQASLQNLSDSIATGGVLDAFTAGVNTIDGWVKAFDRLSPRTKENTILLAGVAAAVGPVLLAIGSVITSVLTAAAAWRTLAAAQTLAGTTAAAATPKVAAMGAATGAGGIAALMRLAGPAAALTLMDGGSPSLVRENDLARLRALEARSGLASSVREGRGGTLLSDLDPEAVNSRIGALLASGIDRPRSEKEQRLVVEFKNTPQGTRVASSGGDGTVDLNVGYAMSNP